MEDNKLHLMASDVSISEFEQQPSNIFLLIRMRMCSTRPNMNEQGVTEAFIDEIVANPDKYGCLP